MTEKLLQFIWRFQYFNRQALQTTNSEPIEVIATGLHNSGQGPDFLQARIRIGGTLLAGSIELHLKTSDWDRHRHSGDANYQNVVLHVVYEHDRATIDLPVLELQPRIPALLVDHYRSLMQSNEFIPCGSGLLQLPDIHWVGWKERLLAERLQRKGGNVFRTDETDGIDWEEGLWRLLARSFGAPANADAFEAVARSVPLKVLARHAHSIQQMEALLLGQARLLDHDYRDEYARLLQREYRFLQKKLGLLPINLPVHFLRMRPQNFPTVRLAQLAALMQKVPHLFSKLLAAQSLSDIDGLLQATANDYWHYHYRFDEPTAFQPKRIGAGMMHNLVINVVVPVLYAYGSYHRNPVFTEKALDLLNGSTPEENTVVRGFRQMGLPVANAADAQALLQLRNTYCNNRRCLECAAGNYLLKRTVSAPLHKEAKGNILGTEL